MIETLRNAWKIADLRKKILFTLFIIFLFRVGSVITVPYLNPEAISAFINNNSGSIFSYFDMLTGGAFSKATLFAMSISPYINASIIINLLTVAIPALEKLQKSGDEGRKKLAQWTRYGTVLLGLIQGWGFYTILRSQNSVQYVFGNTGFGKFFTATIIVLSFTAGTALIMWLAEQINDKGIGNGISIILFAGIIARFPAIIGSIGNYLSNGTLNIFTLTIFVIVALLVVALVVLMNNAERRIPVQYAKRVVGRKMYGGQSTHIPIKVNNTGVMPIIFASSIVAIPSTIAGFLAKPAPGSFWEGFLSIFNYTSIFYGVLYFILIIAFNYFYTEIQFNPVEIANNLQKNGGFILGLRPGKPTAEFIRRILSKITLFGALFLGLVATLPIILSSGFGLNIALGGTTLLIVVGVALETVRTLESQMLMRHYKGFLE